MASQQEELKIAQARIAAGKGSKADIANVDYAKSKGLFNAPTVKESAGTTGSLAGTLSTDQTDFDIMRDLSKQIAKTAQQGAASRGLDIAQEADINLFNPASQRAAIESGALSKFDIKDIYQTTLDRVSKLEETQKEGISYITQLATEIPDFFKQLSGEEIDYIKSVGTPHQSTLTKIAQYKIEHPEEDKRFVENLRAEYFDAGIEITDTPAQAKDKVIKGSSIYREKVSPPRGGGGEPSDRFLSLDEIADLREDNPDKADVLTFGIKLSDITALGLKAISKPNTDKSITEAERRQAAQSVVSSFTDKLGGWGVPDDLKADVEKQFGVPKDKLSDSELEQFLVGQFGVPIQDAQSIRKSLE